MDFVPIDHKFICAPRETVNANERLIPVDNVKTALLRS
jgi:hypothetical protein